MSSVSCDMGRPRSVDLSDGVRVEYVATRKVLRLTGLPTPIEIPAETLVALGVRTGADRQYLLFGGQKTRGGSRDLIGVYRDEGQAKAAFRELRANLTGGWGEVWCLDGNGTYRQRCWFDDGRGSDAGGETSTGRRWWRRP